jgi:hypothetical protein
LFQQERRPGTPRSLPNGAGGEQNNKRRSRLSGLRSLPSIAAACILWQTSQRLCDPWPESLTSIVLSLSKLSAMGLMAVFYSQDPLRGVAGSATPSGSGTKSATGTATGRPLHHRPWSEIYWPAARKEGKRVSLGMCPRWGMWKHERGSLGSHSQWVDASRPLFWRSRTQPWRASSTHHLLRKRRPSKDACVVDGMGRKASGAGLARAMPGIERHARR